MLRLVKWEILPVLPSWKLSEVGILANKALGPRTLLANIPTPLNLQLVNTDTVLSYSVLHYTKIQYYCTVMHCNVL